MAGLAGLAVRPGLGRHALPPRPRALGRLPGLRRQEPPCLAGGEDGRQRPGGGELQARFPLASGADAADCPDARLLVPRGLLRRAGPLGLRVDHLLHGALGLRGQLPDHGARPGHLEDYGAQPRDQAGEATLALVPYIPLRDVCPALFRERPGQGWGAAGPERLRDVSLEALLLDRPALHAGPADAHPHGPHLRLCEQDLLVRGHAADLRVLPAPLAAGDPRAPGARGAPLRQAAAAPGQARPVRDADRVGPAHVHRLCAYGCLLYLDSLLQGVHPHARRPPREAGVRHLLVPALQPPGPLAAGPAGCRHGQDLHDDAVPQRRQVRARPGGVRGRAGRVAALAQVALHPPAVEPPGRHGHGVRLGRARHVLALDPGRGGVGGRGLPVAPLRRPNTVGGDCHLHERWGPGHRFCGSHPLHCPGQPRASAQPGVEKAVADRRGRVLPRVPLRPPQRALAVALVHRDGSQRIHQPPRGALAPHPLHRPGAVLL
mmetsp:Transcript_99728/g.311474  ORF Transcript_99728/g.311474 Transcript_99728/m.311474 type:complete len:490 (+) Transcript_99728:954-2423(+)